MKLLFTILFFVPFIASASSEPPRADWWNEFVWHRYNEKTHTWWSNTIIGSGSGTFSKTSMGALTPGDTLFVTAGAYTAGNVSFLSGNPGDSILVMSTDWATGGRINCNGTWTWHDNNYLKLYAYSGNTNSAHFQISAAHVSNCRFTKLKFTGTGSCFSTFNNIPFTFFDTTTFVTYNIRIDSFYATGTSQLVRGSFGNLSNNVDFQYGLEIDHGYYENPTNDGDMCTGIFGRMLFHDNVIYWTASSYTDIHDVGTITGGGGACGGGHAGALSGEFYNNAVYGRGFGRGWFIRANVFNFQGKNDSLHIYNNFKGGTLMMGFAQVQILTCDTVSGQIHGANANIDHNICGNMFSTESAFESVLAYVGEYPVYRLRITNNIITNSSLNGSPFIHSVGSPTHWVPSAGDTSNNNYFGSFTIAQVDSSGSRPTYGPLSIASPLYHTGVTTGVTVDAYGNAYATPNPSRGHMEFGSAPPPPSGGNTIPAHTGLLKFILVRNDVKDKFFTKPKNKYLWRRSLAER